MIPLYLQAYVVIAVIAISFFLIYRQSLKPTITLLLANLIFVLTGILSAKQLLAGLSNESIISIILLILLTAGIRKNFDIEMLFDKVYRNIHGYRHFLLAMMSKVALVSSLMNNTPVVAAMTPYVFNWGKKHNIAPSKLLIPLSYATICGGMITLIGTSTTLVLNGFLVANELSPLNVSHIFITGITVTILVLVYLVLFGHRLLAEKSHLLEQFNQNTREYLVETYLTEQSSFKGKTVAEAGLRNLTGVYLVEIIRGQQIISPVDPEQKIENGDILIFAGNTSDIVELVTPSTDLTLPGTASSLQRGNHRLIEVVVSPNSSLAGKKVNASDFRNRYHAAIVAMHRNGERLSGKIGEQQIRTGDLLLLYAGDRFQKQLDMYRDLLVISELGRMKKPSKHKILGVSLMAVTALILLVTGVFSLFVSLLIIFSLMAGFKMITMQDLKREVDLNLLAMLVFSLAMGTAVVNSGAGTEIANLLVEYFSPWGNSGLLAALLIVTAFLTSFISNVGAVSVTFPIAMALGQTVDVDSGVFFLGVAFAASAAFSTPMGYQTNLMVYGPGGYNFKDFFRAGLPVTILYLVIVFIMLHVLYF